MPQKVTHVHCISSLGEKRSEFRRTRGWKRACMDPATQLMVHGILWPAKRSPWSNSEGRLVEVRGKRRKQCGSGQVDGAARTISSRRTWVYCRWRRSTSKSVFEVIRQRARVLSNETAHNSSLRRDQGGHQCDGFWGDTITRWSAASLRLKAY